MPLEERLIDRDILDPHNSSIRFKLHHTINQQKWVTMGQESLNLCLFHDGHRRDLLVVHNYSVAFLFILAVELFHHLVSHIQYRLMVDDDFDDRVVSLVDDRHVPLFLCNGLRSIVDFL